MKLKNFLIESGYLLGMLIAPWFTVLSCAAHAQQVFSVPDAYHRVYPKAPENGYVLYTRNDSLFAKFSSGDEKYLNVAHGVYEPAAQAKPGYSLKGVLRTAIKADSLYAFAQFGWVTDSIKWVVTDTTFEGEPDCKHDWVYGNIKHGSIDFHFTMELEIVDCAWLNPDGAHCNEHESATREKICRRCSRGEIEREQWYQRFVAPLKSEFERLKEKQNARHR